MVDSSAYGAASRVLLAPSYGERAVRKRWHDTMDTPVPFGETPVVEHLTSAERRELDEHHPDGTARFWGAKPLFDADMDQLSTGDLVFFTGESRLRYIGTLA